MSTLSTTTYSSNTVWTITPSINLSGKNAASSTAILNTKGKYLDKDILIQAGSKDMGSGAINSSVTSASVSTTSSGSYYIKYKSYGTTAGYIDTNTTGNENTQYITAASIGNSESTVTGYTENTSVVVPSQGYLKITAGYIPNTLISLDQMLDGKADTAGTASTDIVTGKIAYDIDGKKLTGTLGASSMTAVSGNGYTISSGTVSNSTLTLSQMITDGAVSTTTGSSTYYSTVTTDSVSASKIGPGYVQTAQYIKAGGISTSISGGDLTGDADATATNATLSTSNTSGIVIQPSYNVSRAATTGSATVSTAGWIDTGIKQLTLSSATSTGTANTKYLTAATVASGKSFSVTNNGTLSVNGGGDKGASFSGKTATIDGTVVTDSNGDLITTSCVHTDLTSGFSQGTTEVITPSVSITNGTAVTSTSTGKTYVIIDPGASVTTKAAATVKPSFTYTVSKSGWATATSGTGTISSATAVTLNDPTINAGTNYYIEIYDGLYSA